MNEGTAHRTTISRYAIAILAGGMIFLTGCVGAPSPTRTEGGPPASGRTAGPPKTLRIGSIREPVAGIALFAGSGDAASQVTPLFHAGLTAFDGQGRIIPRIAQKIPSVDDGDWRVLPDGGMEVTWKLRPDVKWHDGAALTADDFVFGIEIARDPEVPLPRTGGVSLVNEVSAPDAGTLVMRWSKAYYAANVANATEFAAVPRHILGDLFRGGDRQAFINSLYWATEFVGLGPYKLGDWVPGSYTEALAFDDSFLGRAKIDRVVLRYFHDANTMVASLLANDYDLVAPGSIQWNELTQVLDAWESQGGKLVTSVTDVTWARLQYRDPEAPWAKDVRVRRALLHLLDRQALADAFSPVGGPADLFAAKTDPVYQLAEQRGFPKYPYDVARAHGLLAETGWTRASDGFVQNNTGQRFNIEVRVVSRTAEGQAIVDQWRQGGLNAEMYTIGKGASGQTELKAINKGLFWQADTLTLDTFEFFRTSQIATEQNRWSGRNIIAYSNPEYDRQYDSIATELNPSRGQSMFADLLRWTAQEVIFLPAYYEVAANTAFRPIIRGPGPVAPISKVATWNIQEWEMD